MLTAPDDNRCDCSKPVENRPDGDSMGDESDSGAESGYNWLSSVDAWRSPSRSSVDSGDERFLTVAEHFC